MEPVTVGLDIGTTSIKAVAVDGTGRVIERIRIPHKVVIPAPNLMEHDAERAWRRGPKRALAALAHLKPAAVAVASMIPSMTAVDRRGRPLTPGLLYGDGRAFSDEAAPAHEPGEIPTSGAEVEGFLKWSASNAPAAHAFWPAQAVANFALGGRPAIDFAVAFTASPLFGADGWDAEICARCGVEPGQLPPVELPGGAAGHVGGSDDGPILTAGTVDVWCEQLVSGATEPGDVHIICGTTLIIWAVASESGETPHPSVWTVPHSVPGLRMVGGASNAGGLFLEWANRLAGKGEEEVDPAHVPVWTPYPRGERTPYHDPRRRAALHDLDLTHGPGAIRRAAWEASGFVVRHHLELGRIQARRIIATGGGTKVAGWMQAIADATGLPVHTAAEPEGAARGAAFLARVAMGAETDVNEAVRWASTGAVVEPRSSWVAPAADRYRRFLELSGVPEGGPAAPEATPEGSPAVTGSAQ